MLNNDLAYTAYKVYIVNGKELIRQLKKTGWVLDRIHGSHHILVKEEKTLSVPVHGSKDLPSGTLNKLLKEAELK